MTETENKKFENEHYLYREADVYTPHSFRKPKLHEMGYFTDNMEGFDNLQLGYEYGELIDYNGDCEKPYRGDFEDNTDIWCGSRFYEGNFAFYIPENSIPQEKREWYRKHRYNTPTYKGYFGPMEDLEVEE